MTRTSTGNSVGMEGRASGPECAKNPHSERETGGLPLMGYAYRLRGDRTWTLAPSLPANESGHWVVEPLVSGPEASSTIRQLSAVKAAYWNIVQDQADELERLRGALERLASCEAFDFPQVIDGPLATEMKQRMDFAARALKTEGTSNDG